MEAQKCAKGSNFEQNGGQKYKIVNLETNLPFGTLLFHKLAKQMVAKIKNNKKCTLLSINGFQRHWKVQKGPNCGQTGIQKYKIVNINANCLIGTLELHKWTNKMVVQMKQYKKCNLQGINSIWGLRNSQKRPNFGQMEVKKYKIFNFKTNCTIRTL